MYHYFFKKDFKSTWSDSGWGLSFSDDVQADLDLTGKTAAERHHKMDSKSLYDSNVLLLNETIAICKSRNIKVLLFTPPAYITYRQHLNQQRLNQTTSLLINIANSNQNVSYMNLIDDKRFVKNDYRDADHLNHTGAKKLSLILNEYIVR
jgi:hypothetical protein